MVKIAIVDDNKEQRETNTIRLRLFLKELNSNIGVIDIFPFDKYSDYYGFIDAENIIALVIDEKLYNDSQDDREPVEYNGSDLVPILRERYKYIPVFTLTNFPTDDELLENVNEFDSIFYKKEFSIKQVEIIHRACQRYLKENQSELSIYNELTKKVASGKAENGDIEKLNALQQKLKIPLSSELKDREIWLKEFEKQIDILEEIRAKLETKLKN